jgi:hypothetical protein
LRKLRRVNYARPAALDDRGGALVQELKPDGAAELAGAIGGPGARGLDYLLKRSDIDTDATGKTSHPA